MSKTPQTDPTDSAPRVVRDCTLDWVKFDAHVARDGSLPPTAKALYAALSTYADASTRTTEPAPDGFDVPTRKVLAACVGVSVDTIDRATVALENYRFPSGARLLDVERRRDPAKPKSHLPSVYRLLDPEHWDDRAAERSTKRRAARGGRTDAARGSRMGAARGGRTDAARGSRMGAAVSIPPRRHPDTHTEEAPLSAAGSAVDEAESVCVLDAPKGENRTVPAAVDGVDVDTVVVRVIDAAMPPKARGRLTAAERRDIAESVAECLGTGHHPAAITRRVDGACNDNTLKPAILTLRGLRELSQEAPDAPTPPQRGDKRSVGLSGGLTGRCSRGSECRDGRLVCSTDLDECPPLCKGQHEPRGKACPECAGATPPAAAGPTFEQQLTDAIGTTPGLMGMDSRAA